MPSWSLMEKWVLPLYLSLQSFFGAFADDSALESIAMKAVAVMQVLLLQKPSKKSITLTACKED